MWDNNTPLQLIKSMPKVLENEHLEKLQKLLEADKLKLQLLGDCELCGNYAPFCDGCNKETKYPCAVSYVNYLKAQGVDISLASDLPDNSTESAEENSVEEVPTTQTEVEDVAADAESEEVAEQSEEKAETDKPVQNDGKKRIRIAIARKKTIF